ncbi:MAG: septal ring lytic transglycosylase RlpA family protein [Deltaproteobacteria bacterium]|nr:septal ring lytic transglycosylase RlpA family protein [Deltaproteobacteria bacterium]
MEIQPNGIKTENKDFKIEPSIMKTSARQAPKDTFYELLKDDLETKPSSLGQGNNNPVEYVVKPGDSLWKISRKFLNKDPYQIAKENGLDKPNLIQPGQKLLIHLSPPPAPPSLETGEVTASWYGAEHHNKVTASGQRFNMNKNTLAHKSLPLGTKVRLVNPENGKTAEGVVNDRGPYVKGRDVDISYALAKQLGFVRKGVTKLNIKII